MRILLAISALAGCGSGAPCTMNECPPSATMDVISVTDPAMLSGTVLMVCVADQCASGAVPMPEQAIGTGITKSLDGALQAEVLVFTAASGIAVTASLFPASVTNGDVYTMSLMSGSTTLASSRLTSVYSTSYPNGMDCQPTCRIATLRP